ncbi:MAG: hypothetical protein ABUT20_27125 [Bacteroidota bacterium]
MTSDNIISDQKEKSSPLFVVILWVVVAVIIAVVSISIKNQNKLSPATTTPTTGIRSDSLHH